MTLLGTDPRKNKWCTRHTLKNYALCSQSASSGEQCALQVLKEMHFKEQSVTFPGHPITGHVQLVTNCI